MLDHLEEAWHEPDDGIWEIRGERRHFVHSKAMAWVAFDRAVRTVEEQGLDGPVDRWRALRDEIHAEVCEPATTPKLGSFTQSYGSTELDASLLMLPLVGFLPATDPRIRGTIEAIERELLHDGFVLRYRTHEAGVDGLPPGEGVFLPCSFWLANCYELLGRHEEARGALRAARRPLERPRAAVRGVRPEGEAAARELPAGVHAPRARGHRLQRRAAPAFADAFALCAAAAS